MNSAHLQDWKPQTMDHVFIDRSTGVIEQVWVEGKLYRQPRLLIRSHQGREVQTNKDLVKVKDRRGVRFDRFTSYAKHELNHYSFYVICAEMGGTNKFYDTLEEASDPLLEQQAIFVEAHRKALELMPKDWSNGEGDGEPC